MMDWVIHIVWFIVALTSVGLLYLNLISGNTFLNLKGWSGKIFTLCLAIIVIGSGILLIFELGQAN